MKGGSGVSIGGVKIVKVGGAPIYLLSGMILQVEVDQTAPQNRQVEFG